MLYRTMKKTGEELSILGYGCMRLPVLEDGRVSKDKAIKEIRHAIDHGINYLDSAYVYHNSESEVVLGEALEDGYRERVNIATKLPCFLIESREQMDAILDEQLERLKTDHIDYYLLHGLNSNLWQKMKGLGVVDFLDTALADGRIKYAGFSFHDNGDAFPEIVDGYDWTFCQIQYNYMDEDYQAGTKGLEYAASRGLGIIVMEPLRGGCLAKAIPAAGKIWSDAESKRNPAGWALKWVWNHPEVTVVLSGMSTMEQVIDNLKHADEGLADSLKSADLERFDRVREVYRERMKTQCTACGYCKPCPNGIDIPACLERYNNAFMFDVLEQEKMVYGFMKHIGVTKSASDCVECGQCEERCPQHLPIPQQLKEFVALFEK